MSMHKIPLTPLEESGLKAHGLDIGTPSQLSDAFRQGVAWASESLRQQLAEANNERAWIRRKLKLPEDTKLLSGEVTLAGTMHNVCNGNHGYRAYIESEKCDDKAGKIARLTVQLAECQATNGMLREALSQVREGCLFTDDDGQIGISSEAQIDAQLFDEICEALALPNNDTCLNELIAEAENRTAEACALFVDSTALYDTSVEIAEDIRLGKYKEHIK